MINFIKSILGDKRKLSIAVIVIIAAAIVLTVFVAQKQQEIRQRAAGEQTDLFFSTGTGCNNKATNTTLSFSSSGGQSSTLSLCLDTKGNIVSGFDISIDPGTSAEFSAIDEGADASKFDTVAKKDITARVIHFSKVNTGNYVPAGVLNLGKIIIGTTSAPPKTGNISVTFAQIVSPISESALSVTQPTLPYAIVATTSNTPTPTSTACAAGETPCGTSCVNLATDPNNCGGCGQTCRSGQQCSSATCVAPTPTAVPTPTPSSGKPLIYGCGNYGDVNGDGKIDSTDALEITRHLAGQPPAIRYIEANADVDNNNQITNDDATIILEYVGQLRTTFPVCSIPTPTPTSAPILTPTTTPTLTLTPTPTAAPINSADIDRNGTINIIDFNLWLRAFQEKDVPPYKTSTGNPYYPHVITATTDPVSILDFNAWLIEFKKANQ